jgi:hypothetical protein
MRISFLIGEARWGLEELADYPEKTETGFLKGKSYRRRLFPIYLLFSGTLAWKSIRRCDYSEIVTCDYFTTSAYMRPGCL